MEHPVYPYKLLRSYGGSFVYEVQGPICRLYDREELPWPSCSLQWRGKQPSWNRQGPRLVPDLSSSRCPSYYVKAYDHYGHQWQQPLSLYDVKLTKAERSWWVWKGPQALEAPASVDEMYLRLESGQRW
jgi:hypothetical protein